MDDDTAAGMELVAYLMVYMILLTTVLVAASLFY